MEDLIRRSDALGCFHDWIDEHGYIHEADEMTEYQAIEALPSVVIGDPTQSNVPNTLDALTNADRIRAMTDEEMVNQFTKTMGFCCPVKGVDCSLEPDCRMCFDRWLKQEVTE